MVKTDFSKFSNFFQKIIKYRIFFFKKFDKMIIALIRVNITDFMVKTDFSKFSKFFQKIKKKFEKIRIYRENFF
jgi:hypothetical protein